MHRHLFKVCVVVLGALALLSTCSFVHAEDYDPSNHPKVWTLLVNGLIDHGQFYKDSHDNDLWSKSYKFKGHPHEIGTLTFNQTLHILSLTVAQYRESGMRVTGKGKVIKSAIETHAVTTVSFVDLNLDAIADFIVKTDTVIDDQKRQPQSMTNVVDINPQGPANKKNFSKKLSIASTWADWELAFMTEFGHKPVMPEPKKDSGYVY